MKIKVQCPCGTRFEFEVEPVNGRMPVPINCPACNADATGLANDLIRQQLDAAPAAPSAATVRVAIARPAPAAPAPAAGLRISKSTHTAPIAAPAAHAAPAPDPSVPHCARHQSEPAVENCRVCGKPMCAKCMEQFGYVCSIYCRQQAEQQSIAVPAYANQKKTVAARSFALVKLAGTAVVLAAMLAVGFWVWYTWFGRMPQIVYSLPIPRNDPYSNKPARPDEYYQLIGPGQILAIKARHVSVFDIAKQNQVWSAPLQTDAEAAAVKAARAKNEEIKKNTPRVRDEDNGADLTVYKGLDPLGFEDDYYFANPQVVVTSNDVWISFPDRLARFDRASGARKELPISGTVQNVAVSDDTILVVSGTPGVLETLTKFSLPGGDAQTEDLTIRAQKEIASSTNAVAVPNAAKIRPVKPTQTTDAYPVSQLKDLAAITGQPKHDDDEDDQPVDEYHHPFIAAGPNVIQLKTRLLERKTITHAAMKAKGKPVLDENLTAGQSMQASEEMLNESRREQTGGVVEEDVSEYMVTIHRRFASDIPDWTGEVVGPPQLFPLKTVDVLCAGQTIYVFDKNNKKLWDAKLTFSVATHLSGDYLPCLETKDSLYFADLGILTRYDLITGNVRWRVNSVGISHVQADDTGALYVDSTTAGPESIQYSQQINIHDKIHPLILKLDPATGKTIWSLEAYGDHAILSGKYLYATRTMTIYDPLRLEEGPDRHFYLRLLNPSDGKEIWSLHKVNHPFVKTDIQKNWILFQLEDQVQVYKFFSL